jgi:hypothetical protein
MKRKKRPPEESGGKQRKRIPNGRDRLMGKKKEKDRS